MHSIGKTSVLRLPWLDGRTEARSGYDIRDVAGMDFLQGMA